MSSQISDRHFGGKVYSFKGNEPILLNDPHTVWIVSSGSVALFAVRLENGVVIGTRRYLFSSDSGEALFGTASNYGSTESQILAIPMGKAELLKLETECFQELVANAEINFVALVEGWLHKFDTTLSSAVVPPIQVRASGKERFSLIAGQTLQPAPNTVLWMQVQEGVLYWLGIKELTLTLQTGMVPLTHAMWIEADGAAQVATKATSSLQNANALLSGLSVVNQQFLFWNQLRQQQERTEELQRLEARENLNQQVTAEALGELASPLMAAKADFFQEGIPLLVAAGAVGKAIGMKISAPGKSEDLERLENPLEAIARSSRLRLRQVLLRDNWWQQDCGPLVAYLQQDEKAHPVALLPISANRYELYNPIAQTRIPVDAEIAARVVPIAYMFYRSFPDKALSVFDVVKFALAGRSKDLLIILIAGVVVSLLGMLTPQATAILIDNAIPDSDRNSLIQVGLGLLLAAFATALFRLVQGFSLLRLETTSDASTQAAMWDRLLNLPVSFFRQYTTGDLLSRTNSVSQIRRELGSTILIQLITSLFAFLNLGLLFYYSPELSLIAVAICVVTIAVTTISGLILVRKVHPLLEIEGNIFGQVVELINGISKLRVAGAQKRGFAFWSKNYSRQIKLELSTQQVEDAVALFNTVMPTLTSGILFWFTVQLLMKAEMTGTAGLSIGTFLAFNSAFGTFVGGATGMSNTLTDIIQIIPQWKRAQPIVQMLPEVQQNKADPGKLMGRIAVDRVCFRYRKDGPLILQDVSIYAEPGEFIALVGGSGSGKSTLLRLLLSFETPEEGSIYYDGQDLSGLDVSAVRRQLGVVLQNGKIMSSSIFDNLAGGARITLDEAWEAAKMAGFADDIDAMPMGMHTVISEGGGNLSGGQRQRLLIAKALVLKPRILLFDEATSALDNRTQAIVSESLDKLQVTRIAIAHRLSTIRNADRIYVLEAGKIVQQGSFDELAFKEGLFAQLMQRQMV
ncbi:MAG: NHLP bacteriocin export ABC transporter permease/ATPase subunit [Nostoc sp. DedQUE12a]|nr:NHLP bacteriocin export ABC transporter permease/ATPase subunit [Nostoc sp. DedQUE12a]